MRAFPTLGWTLFLVPIDLLETRIVARVFMRTILGFKDVEIVDLRARRLTMEGEAERTWWVMAIRSADVENRVQKKEN